jgi:hypothetical protein
MRDNSEVDELIGKGVFDQLKELQDELNKTVGIIDTVNKKDLINKQAFAQLGMLIKAVTNTTAAVDELNTKLASAQSVLKAAKSFEQLAAAEEKAGAVLGEVVKVQQSYIQSEVKLAAAISATSAVVEEGVKVLNQNAASRESLTKIIAAQRLELDGLSKQQKKLDQDYSRGKLSAEAYQKGIASLESARSFGQTALSKYRQELAVLTKEEMANDSSYKQKEQTLSRLKTLYKELSDAQIADPAIGGRLKPAIDELDTAVKNAGGSMGEFQRNVGNYAITTKTLQGELLQLKNILAQLYSEGNGNSAQAQEVRKRINELSVSVGKVTKETKLFRSQTRVFDSLVQGAQAAASAFGVYKSTLTLIGVEGEAAEKVTQKLAAVIAMVTSLQQLQRLAVEKNALSWALLTTKQKLYNVVVGQSTGLVKGLRIAMAGVLGASIIGGIILLIANWGKLKDAITGSSREQRLYNDVAKKTSEFAKEEGKQISELMGKINQAAMGTRERKKAIDEFNKTYGNYLTNLLTEKSTVEDLKKAYQELTPVLVEQSTLRATQAKMDELSGKRIDLIQKQAKEQEKLNKATEKYNSFPADAPEKSLTESTKGGMMLGTTEKGFAKNEVDDATEALDTYKKELDDVDKDINMLGNAAAETAQKLAAMAKGTYDASEAGKELAKSFDKANQQAMDDVMKGIDDYLSEQDKAFVKNAENSSKLNKLDKDVFKRMQERVQQKIDLNLKGAKLLEDANESRLQKELQAEYDRYKKGEISYKQYQNNVKKLEKKGEQTSIELQLSYLQYVIDSCDLEYEVRKELQKKVDELKKKSRDNELKEEGKLKDKLKELQQEAYNFIVNLSNSQFERQKQAVDKEEQAVDEQTKKDIKAIEQEIEAEQREIQSSTLSTQEKNDKIAESEEQKNNRIAAAEAQAEAKHEALERKKALIARQQAMFQRNLQIMQTIVATARAVSEALPDIPLAGIIAGIGAFQLATILSTPIPAYEKGTDDHKGGLAIVGEKRKELIVTPDGNLMLTGDHTQVVDMPKHTQVLPDAKLALQQMAYNASKMPQYSGNTMVDISSLEQGLAELKNAVVTSAAANKASLSVSLDREGIYQISEGKGGARRYINQRLKR